MAVMCLAKRLKFASFEYLVDKIEVLYFSIIFLAEMKVTRRMHNGRIN